MSEPDSNLWNQILDRLREEVEPEDYRRWLLPTSYASDSGDLISVWVPTEATRRYLSTHYASQIERLLRNLRPHSAIRFVVAGTSDEEEDEY
jgi:chromosomal replication initiation ATPase DnaA